MDRGNTGSVPRNSLAESITGVAKEVRKPRYWQLQCSSAVNSHFIGCGSEVYSALIVVDNFTS